MKREKDRRSKAFFFKVTPEEREKIRILAEKLRRNESDAVRITVLEKVEELEKVQPAS